MRLFLGLGVALAIGASVPGNAFGQVPEIPDYTLNDIARVQMTPQGPIILWNPNVCRALGINACRFMRLHEYGHIVNGDQFGSTFPPLAEMRADCFAAQNAPLHEFNAAVVMFRRQGSGGDAAHGTGFQRAQRIIDMRFSRNCHW